MKFRSVLVVLLLLFSVGAAHARQHHLVQHRHHHYRHVAIAAPQPSNPFAFLFKSDPVQPTRHMSYATEERPAVAMESGGERPSDCYGIAWCGCWLRHHFGISDRGLNLARNWARVGSPTAAHSGAVVVWNGHVGVLQSEVRPDGRALVLSGNNGSGNSATTRLQYVRNAIAFRDM